MTANVVEEGLNPSLPVNHDLWYLASTGNFIHSTWSRSVSQRYYYHWGETTPDFYKRKKSGELLPYTYWLQNEVSGSATGYQYTTKTSGGNTWSFLCEGYTTPGHIQPWCLTGLMVSDFLTEHSDEIADGHRLVQAAAANIYSSGWDTLTFLAELHHVKRMFSNFLGRTLNLLSSGKLHKLWLEGRYGWRILVYDMIEINKAIENLDSERRSRFKQRVGEKGTVVTTETFKKDYGGMAEYTYVNTFNWSVRGSVIADISPPAFAFNPITTAWELITLSFVIDWIVNIGRALEALSFSALAQKYYAATGLKFEMTRVGSSVLVDADVTGYSGTIDWKSESTYKRTWRVPTTVSHLPYFNLNFSPAKVLDLISILLQKL